MSERRTTVVVPTRDHIVTLTGDLDDDAEYWTSMFIEGLVKGIKRGDATVLSEPWTIKYTPRAQTPRKQIRLRMFPS